MTKREEEAVLLACPRCGAESDSIKQFTIPYSALFLLLYFSWSSAHYTSCPSCMRRFILIRMAITLIPANITWPIFALVAWGPQFARTFSQGHTRWIRKQIAAGNLVLDSTPLRREGSHAA